MLDWLIGRPREFRDAAPRIVRDERGEAWLFEGESTWPDSMILRGSAERVYRFTPAPRPNGEGAGVDVVA
ncbi:MAG: hypothetical protein WD271_13105 [Acidimicrobiia bacterium]